MHRTIGFLSKHLLSVRPGEERKVWLTFLYFFLVITAYYIIKPVSRSLILDDLGSRLVPYVDLISAIMMGPMVSIFARLVDRLPKRRIVTLMFGASVVSLLIFWKLLAYPVLWVPAAFYVWVAIFSVLVVTLFWLVANDLYHPREAKRLFGFIGSGGILGGIVGSAIAALGARAVGTPQLLIASAALLVLCWFVVRDLWHYAVVRPESVAAESVPAADRRASVFTLLFQSRYLMLLVGLVGIAKIISTLIYYQFNPFIEQMFPGQDAKTAFTGLFFGWMNVASFAVQFFFTSLALRRFGLGVTLLALPIGLLVGSTGMLVAPLFWVAASTELFDGSLNYSLQQTSKEVLYLPIDRSIRYKVKPFIDMVVFRFGKGIAAIIGIVFLDVWHLEARLLSLLTLPLIVVWIAIALQLRHDYVTAIRGILQARAASRRRPKGVPTEEGHRDHTVLADPHHAWLEAATPYPVQQKLALVRQLVAANREPSEESKQLLEALAEYEQRPHDPLTLEEGLPSMQQLKDWLSDPHQPMTVRRAAIKQLAQQGGQEAVDSFLGLLMVEEDAVMRQELIRGLTKLRLRQPKLEFPKRLIRRQLIKEVGKYRQIFQVASVYRQMAGARCQDPDPAMELLKLSLEETVDHIFRLLSLLYRPEDIHLIYNQLREPDAYVRADAIELLDNLVHPRLRRLIVPVLDEDTFMGCLDGELTPDAIDQRDAVRLMGQSIWDHNRWLSVVVLCAIGRLRLEPLLSELDRAAQSRVPILRIAALAAQRLAVEAV